MIAHTNFPQNNGLTKKNSNYQKVTKTLHTLRKSIVANIKTSKSLVKIF